MAEDPHFTALTDAIEATKTLSTGATPAKGVFKNPDSTWGIYSIYWDTMVSVPDRTALGYHFESTGSSAVAFEGDVKFPFGHLSFDPFVGAIVDGSSVWLPNSAAATARLLFPRHS